MHLSSRNNTSESDLIRGLDFETVDAQVALAVRSGEVARRRLAFWLGEVAECGHHQRFGYSRATLYAEARYGIPARNPCYRKLERNSLRTRRMTILDKIIATKREEIAAAKARRSDGVRISSSSHRAYRLRKDATQASIVWRETSQGLITLRPVPRWSGRMTR